MKYVSIAFLPGAAGNFFSRCLNLLDNAHCFVPPGAGLTIDDKLEILGYTKVIDKDFGERNWLDFEFSLEHIKHRLSLPSDALYIVPGHPMTTTHTHANLYDLAGDDDEVYNFYIDTGNHFEWAYINALYKDSFLRPDWFLNGQVMLQDPNMYKIQLSNFLGDWGDFKTEFTKTCTILGHALSVDELRAVETLHKQWKQTILEYKDMDSFKKLLGFIRND